MQRLILMRHADAERSAASGRDRDRALSPPGRNEATAMGRLLARRGFRPDLALVSSATRTRQTWELAHESFGDVDLRLEEDLYNASSDVLREAIQQVAEEAGCLILVAHNPGVHQLAVELLIDGAASPAAVDRLSSGFPTGAAAVFSVSPEGRPSFDGFFQPRDAGA